MTKNTAQFILSMVLGSVLLLGTSIRVQAQDSVHVSFLAVLKGKIATGGATRDTSFVASKGTALKVVKKDTVVRVFTCELGSVTDIQVQFYQVDRSAWTPVSVTNTKSTSTTRTETESKPNVKAAEPKESPSSGRCSAYTKNGTQCSRSAGSSGRCWQH